MVTPEEQMDPELVHDVFAAFGRAYFFSECLSRELANLCVITSIPDHRDALSPRYEEEFRRAFSLTLGQLIDRAAPYIDEQHSDDLARALQLRNHLAHHFWYERAHLMFSESGLNSLGEELQEMGTFFHSLDREITAEALPRYEAKGLTEEKIAEHTWEVVSGRPYQPLPTQRYPAKRERVVDAWLITGDSRGVVPILVTEDGLLWQLTDIGLGWTPYDSVAPTWQPFVELSNHLPAEVVPRPKVSQPWNYDLEFSSGCRLVIRRSSQGRLTYRLSAATGTREP
jgi:hypothetical protein